MCITEYDEQRAFAELEEDAREDGRKEGIEEGRKEGIEEGRKEGIEEGRKEGIEEGRKEGIEEGKLEDALNMLAMGTISKEDIAKITGFAIEKIRELAVQNGFVSA